MIWISKIWKRKNKEETCPHDWEVVKESRVWGYVYYATAGRKPFATNLLENPDTWTHTHKVFVICATDRVCLLCGECDLGIQKCKEEYQERVRKEEDRKIMKRERKLLAQNIYKTVCNKT